MKVLIVDDEDLPRRIVETRVPWQKIGFDYVLTASQGREAFAIAQAEQPDLIISDIKMPKMDGLTLAHAIKEHFPATCIILLTNYGDKDNLKKAIKLKIDSFIDKPIKIEEITREVEELVAVIQKTRAKTAGSLAPSLAQSGTQDADIIGILKQKDTVYASDRQKYAALITGTDEKDRGGETIPIPAAVSLAAGFIQEHFSDPQLSLTLIAEKTGYALTYLCRIFKLHAKQTLNECIMNMRMLKAKELLFKTDWGIYRIGSEAGYINGKYFVKLFKRKTGLHPEGYRRQVKDVPPS